MVAQSNDTPNKTMATQFFDNPDLNGQPLAQRNGMAGGGTFMQAFFEDDGSMNNQSFFGDDGSQAWNLEQLREMADGFRFDNDSLRADRALEMADMMAELSSRGPEWARACGMPED